jgi:type IV secretion system protein VirB5
MTAATELLQKRTAAAPKTFPESAFARAREEWADRVGAPIKSARNWRLATFGLLAVLAMAIGGLIYQSSKSVVVPYYIRVAENGAPMVVGVVPEHFTPTLNDVRWQLGTWLQWVRGTSLDPVVVNRNYRNALNYMRTPAVNKLNEWAQKDDRFQSVGHSTVEVAIKSVAPISGSASYQARWTEIHRDNGGGVKAEEHWAATFDVEIVPPTSADQIQRDPIGLFIRDFQWTREL